MYYVTLSDETYYQKSGSPLKKIPLKVICQGCKDNLTNDNNKGSHGSIFTYINNVLGVDYWPNHKIFNDGVMFCDIDWITKECADCIFDSFDRIKLYFPSLLATQFSASYYDETSKKAGLHVYIATYELDNNDYEEIGAYAYMALFKAIEKVTGYDLRIGQVYDEEHQRYGTIIDLHNIHMYQRFGLYYSDYRWNDNVVPFSLVDYENVIDKLEEYYKDFIPVKKKKVFNDISFIKQNEEYEATNITLDKKIKVDRNLVVGSFSGSDLRWRIAAIANNLFGDKGKEWCDKYFYYENDKSIWQNANYTPNYLVVNWLMSKKLIANTLDNSLDYSYEGEGTEVKTWLKDEQYDFIKSEIDKHKVICIEGDPGIGKTNCFGCMAKENNWVIMTPFLDMRHLYEVNGLTVVDKSNRYHFDFQNNACVFVYDQLPKVKDKIIGKTIVIDESHVAYKDRLFRNTLIEVENILKDWTGKIVIVSATPLEETKTLKVEKTLKFWKRRSKVEVVWQNVKTLKDMKYLAEKVVMMNLNDEHYTQICLFGNRSPRMIYDNLTIYYGRDIHNKVNIFHNDYREIGDIDRVKETEVLDKKVNLGTSLVYNGLNFKNEGGKILVVIEYEEGQSGWWDIIQACSRVRLSKIVVYVIASKKSEDNVNLDEKIEDAKFLDQMGIDKNLIGYNHNLVEHEDVVRELDVFNERNCTIEYAIEVLKSKEWINVTVNDEDFHVDEKKTNLLRKKIDDIIKKQMNGVGLDDKEIETIKDGKEYYDATIDEINKVCMNYDIDSDYIIRLNNSETIQSKNNVKTVTLRTTIDHIEYNVKAAIDNIDYWNNIMKQLEKNYMGNVLYKIRKKEINDIIQTWNNYHKYFDGLELSMTNGYGNVKGMIEQMIEENEKKNEEKSKKRANARSKKIKDLMTGKEYESATECAKDIDKSNAFITKHKDRFISI